MKEKKISQTKEERMLEKAEDKFWAYETEKLQAKNDLILFDNV